MSRRAELTGTVVAITGGARGIGREIGRQLAAAGAMVALGDRDADAARKSAAELGGTVRGLHLDVTSTESFAGFLAAVEREWSRPIDVLVNNAGVMWVGPFDEEPESAAAAQVEVNLLGVIRGITLAAPAMAARGAGHIVTIASAASLLAPPGEATYAATKHGVLGYVTAVRAELHRRGVDLSVVMPAVVDTALAAGTASGAAAMLQPAQVAAVVVDVIRRPRFEVTVPRFIGPLHRVIDLLPRPVRDAVLRRLVPDQVQRSDRTTRSGYESTFVDPGPVRPTS